MQGGNSNLNSCFGKKIVNMEGLELINLHDFDDFCLKNEMKIYEKAFENIAESKEVKKKCKMIVNDKSKMRELQIIFLIIKDKIKQETKTKSEGIAFQLMRIIMSCLDGAVFWEKLMLIIVCHKNKSIKVVLDDLIEINCIYEVI